MKFPRTLKTLLKLYRNCLKTRVNVILLSCMKIVSMHLLKRRVRKKDKKRGIKKSNIERI